MDGLSVQPDVFTLTPKEVEIRLLALSDYKATSSEDHWRNLKGSIVSRPDICSSLARWKTIIWPVLNRSNWEISITHSAMFGWCVSVFNSVDTFTAAGESLELTLAQVSLLALQTFRKPQ